MGYWMETQQDCSFILFSRQTNTIKRTTIYTNRCICILIVVRSMHGTQPFERDGLRRIRRLARSENTDTSLFNFSLGLAIYWKTIRTVCFITIEALSTLTAPVAEDNLISLYDRCPQDSLACKFDRGGRRTLHPHQASTTSSKACRRCTLEGIGAFIAHPIRILSRQLLPMIL